MHEILKSDAIKERYKLGKNSFSRKRKMGFKEVVGLGMNILTKSLQLEIEHFLERVISKVDERYTKQAFSKARAKFSPALFCEMNATLLTTWYEDDNCNTIEGLRLFAIDGTMLELPQNEEMKRVYGVVNNHKNLDIAMSKSSMLYEIGSGLVWHAIMGHRCDSERDMALEHLQFLQEIDAKSSRSYKNLVVFDRGYPSYALMLFLKERNIDFLMRTKADIEEVSLFMQDQRDDAIVTLKRNFRRKASVKNHKQPLIRNLLDTYMLNGDIQVRLLKIDTAKEEPEILVTSLLDIKEYPHAIFKTLYHARWDIETHYDICKNKLQIENFSGQKLLAVNQDFFAAILSRNLQQCIENDALEAFQKEKQSTTKYEYAINVNFSIGYLKDKLVLMLLEDKDTTHLYERLVNKIKANVVPIRPNRHYPRSPSRRKYPMNSKKSA